MGINGLLRNLRPSSRKIKHTPAKGRSKRVRIDNSRNNCYNESNSNTQLNDAELTSLKTDQKQNILDFKGLRVAIDGSVLLFKAAYSCADILVEDIDVNGVNDHSDIRAERKYTSYVLNFCDNLLHHAKLKSLTIVFDSPDRLPLKEMESKAREEKRQIYLKNARRLKALGNSKEGMYCLLNFMIVVSVYVTLVTLKR